MKTISIWRQDQSTNEIERRNQTGSLATSSSGKSITSDGDARLMGRSSSSSKSTVAIFTHSKRSREEKKAVVTVSLNQLANWSIFSREIRPPLLPSSMSSTLDRSVWTKLIIRSTPPRRSLFVKLLHAIPAVLVNWDTSLSYLYSILHLILFQPSVLD